MQIMTYNGRQLLCLLKEVFLYNFTDIISILMFKVGFAEKAESELQRFSTRFQGWYVKVWADFK